MVAEHKDPSSTWSRLCAEHPEVPASSSNFSFPGQGQRQTSVVDVKGVATIIALLPGKAAAQFRCRAANLLVRFMGGDETLIADVQGIAQFHKEGKAEGTLAALCAEQNHDPQSPTPIQSTTETQQQVVQSTTLTQNKQALHSPTMIGQHLYMYNKKCVCYLIVFTVDGVVYIKFGCSRDVVQRMTDHYAELPNASL